MITGSGPSVVYRLATWYLFTLLIILLGVVSRRLVLPCGSLKRAYVLYQEHMLEIAIMDLSHVDIYIICPGPFYFHELDVFDNENSQIM